MNDSYSDGFHMGPLGDGGSPERLPIDPVNEIPQTLRCGNYVERWWHSSSFFKVTDPQFTTSEFPFSVGSLLHISIANPKACHDFVTNGGVGGLVSETSR